MEQSRGQVPDLFFGYRSLPALAADSKTGEGSSEQLATTFHGDFYLPPMFAGPTVLSPEPYRVDGVQELLDEHGCLNSVYHKPVASVASAAKEERKGDTVKTVQPMEIEDV